MRSEAESMREDWRSVGGEWGSCCEFIRRRRRRGKEWKRKRKTEKGEEGRRQ